MEYLTWFRPSSMRLAISISPWRVNSSTVPISRMYILTGSVVRPNSASTLANAASASSTASSSLETTESDNNIDSASGAFSCTAMPMSLIILTMSALKASSASESLLSFSFLIKLSICSRRWKAAS